MNFINKEKYLEFGKIWKILSCNYLFLNLFNFLLILVEFIYGETMFKKISQAMNKETLASIITRLYFCNDTKLENKEEFMRMKKDLLALNENDFCQKLMEFGFYDKEAS